MGYCWTSGKKINGRWKFTSCNGNSNREPNNCFPESTKDNPRCKNCAEWCKTWTEARRIVIEHDEMMK